MFIPNASKTKTNGVTQRRFLGLCNPALSTLIGSRIGYGFMTDLYELKKLEPLIDDELIRGFIAVKREAKRKLSDIIPTTAMRRMQRRLNSDPASTSFARCINR